MAFSDLMRLGSGESAVMASLNDSLAMIYFKPDGTIIKANDNFLTAMGYALAEIKGQHHSMFMEAAAAQSPEYAAFWDALRSGQRQSAQFKRLGKGGKEIWIEATYSPVKNAKGHVVMVVKCATDVTAAVNAKEVLNHQKAIIDFNLDGTVIDANDNFLAAMGYQLDEIKGQHHSMFVDQEFAASPEYGNLWATLRAGQFHSGEFQRFGKGGKEVWIDAHYIPVFGNDGAPYKVTKYATDTTEFRRMQTDLASVSSSVASAAEELSSSVHEIASSANETQQMAATTVDKLQSSSTDINQMVEMTSEMTSVLEIINNIGDQINLLALNAAIEAARAGDAGRGFAVVADEVKKLASQSNSSSQDISHKINELQESVKGVSAALAEIGNYTQGLLDNASKIASSTEEQAKATQDIAQSMTHLNGLSQKPAT